MSAPPGLLDWLRAPDGERGIRFARDDGSWRRWSYVELGALAVGTAERLREAGARAGHPVVIVGDNEPLFVGAFFGTLLAGATPCPLAPPPHIALGGDPVTHIASVLSVARPALLASNATYAEMLAGPAHAAGVPLAVLDEHLVRSPTPSPLTPPAPPALALLQFTSGSTRRPRGVRVGARALTANVEALRQRVYLRPGEAGVSWLPVYHDMGLIGCLLLSVLGQSDLWLLRPDQFLRWPDRWLRCLGDGRAIATAAPSFAFPFAQRRVQPAALRGLDFGGWRIAFVGGERIDALALGRFAQWLAPHGFRRTTFMPAYGLAEATLAVTVGLPGDPPRAVPIPAGRSAMDQPVRTGASRPLEAVDPDGSASVVGCGRPFAGMEIEVRDPAGHGLSDGVVGEIVVSGPCLADGYLAEEAGEEGTTRFVGGRLWTGDAGFLSGGELYVIGRLGDGVQVRGANVFVEDLEASIRDVSEARPGRAVVVAGPHGDEQLVALIAEAEPGPWIHEAARRLARVLDDSCLLVVACGGPGSILRTTSGKPRRRLMWQGLAHRSSHAAIVLETRPSAARRPSLAPEGASKDRGHRLGSDHLPAHDGGDRVNTELSALEQRLPGGPGPAGKRTAGGSAAEVG